ncbi:MAG: glycerate kinase [Candidatus Helarchaeota archaeon]|nr:glycerate kinase [Candidatus Helarchaeota archaeon]
MLIKNREILLEVSNPKTREIRRRMLDLLEIALQSINVSELLSKSMIFNKIPNFDDYNNIYVLGFGKASGGMAEQIEKILGATNITDGIVIVPKIIKQTINVQKIKILEADHPIPSRTNIEASNHLINVIKEIPKKNSLIFILISGGGSALLTLPYEGIKLEDISNLTELLLNCGADIKEINIVRKHIGKFKGGKLVKKLYPAKIISFLISDVGKYPPEFIASGPTYPDQSTYQNAMDILKKYSILEQTPTSIIDNFKKGIRGEIPENPSENDPCFSKTENIIVGNLKNACKAVYDYANKHNITPYIYPKFIEGEARDIGKKLIDLANEIYVTVPKFGKPLLFIAGGETTVTVKGSGKGGRCQELILGSIEKLENFKQAVMLAIGTDGIDGNSDAAGAIIDNNSFLIANNMGLKVENYLNNNDSYTFFKELRHNLIFTGPTGTNVSDLVLLLLN